MRPLFAIAPLALLLSVAGSHRDRPGLSDAPEARGARVHAASAPEHPRNEGSPMALRTATHTGHQLTAEALAPQRRPR